VIVFTVVPKNSGLRRYRDIAVQNFGLQNNEKLEVRGEDVPFWVESLIKKGKKAIGLTGQDLFREYTLENYNTQLKTLKIVGWDDDKALFRKPTLCLLGPNKKDLNTIPRSQTVCISKKYKTLAKKYLNLLETKGYTFQKIYVSGSTESSYQVGIADLVIDIVYSGKSINELGLSIYEKIFYSNFVIIGGKQ
jgi:ATP phosphoribosyltransferase